MLSRDCGDSIYTRSALRESREPWESVCVCSKEKIQVVLSRDCGDSVYTSSALASKWTCIGAVGSSRRGVGMDSYSTKASPWLRNAFVNLFQEVRNRDFFQTGGSGLFKPWRRNGLASSTGWFKAWRRNGLVSNGSGMFKAWRRN